MANSPALSRGLICDRAAVVAVEGMRKWRHSEHRAAAAFINVASQRQLCAFSTGGAYSVLLKKFVLNGNYGREKNVVRKPRLPLNGTDETRGEFVVCGQRANATRFCPITQKGFSKFRVQSCTTGCPSTSEAIVCWRTIGYSGCYAHSA